MEDLDRQEILDDIGYLIDVKDKPKLRAIAIGSHSADLADLLRYFDHEQKQFLFNTLDAETASEVIMELDEDSRENLVKDLKNDRLSELVGEMESDDAADFVGELPEHIATEILNEIEPEDSAEVKQLLRHAEDTAGGIMALELVALEGNQTVDQAIQEVRKKAEEIEELYNVYVVDKDQKLIGVLDLRRLILAGPHMRLNEIMDRDFTSVAVDMDQEVVANQVRKYDLVAVPVVDSNDKLVGRITVDDIVDVIEEEVVEDISHMAGISVESNLRESSILSIAKVRLPWLVFGLLGGMVAAWLLKFFEHALQDQIIALLFFVPVIMAMGGNAAIQASTIIVRALATGDIDLSKARQRIFREVGVAILNGAICAVLIYLIILLIWQDATMGLLVGSSLLCVMFCASIIGASVPLGLRRLNIDPAIATGPFITISNDVLGLFIYMGIAYLYFNNF